MSISGDFVTTKEAADILGVSPIRVRQFKNENRIAAVTAGNILLFRKKDVVVLAKKARKHGRPSKG